MGRNKKEDLYEDVDVYGNETWKNSLRRRMSGCGAEDSSSVQITVIHYCQQAHKCKSCIRDIFIIWGNFNDPSLKAFVVIQNQYLSK